MQLFDSSEILFVHNPKVVVYLLATLDAILDNATISNCDHTKYSRGKLGFDLVVDEFGLEKGFLYLREIGNDDTHDMDIFHTCILPISGRDTKSYNDLNSAALINSLTSNFSFPLKSLRNDSRT